MGDAVYLNIIPLTTDEKCGNRSINRKSCESQLCSFELAGKRSFLQINKRRVFRFELSCVSRRRLLSRCGSHRKNERTEGGRQHPRQPFGCCRHDTSVSFHHPQQMIHWQARPVVDLSWSIAGSSIISGGEERVLVKYILHQQGRWSREFLPRLGAAIVRLQSSPDGSIIAVALSDNCKRQNQVVRPAKLGCFSF